MTTLSPLDVLAAVDRAIDDAVQAAGGATPAVDPGHRMPLPWPPHPVSADYHVPPSAWRPHGSVQAHGVTVTVEAAETAHGVFGRLEQVWNEVRAETVEALVPALLVGAEPFFKRRMAIAQALGLDGPYLGAVRDLDAARLVRLLYCRDRDAAHEAMLEIETRASSGLFTPALVRIVEDDRHPLRRTAQWCVLDMFEDLPSFCPTTESQRPAIEAVKRLMWTAEDDFARAVYKAGVVLGGHVCTAEAGRALVDCVVAPSRYGRRSAIHAVFHLVEWAPDFRGEVLDALDRAAEADPEPLLRRFAASQRRDIAAGEHDHVAEPKFPDEP